MKTTAKLQRKRLPLALSSLLLLTACGELNESDAPIEIPSNKLTMVRLQSTLACQVDADCVENHFCFQNICTTECSTDSDCESGESCSDTGRCIRTGAGTSTSQSISNPVVDDTHRSAVEEDMSHINVVQWPPAFVTAVEGETSVWVSIELDQKPTGGVLPYTIIRHDTSEVSPRQRATGEQIFEIEIPIPAERTGNFAVDIVTSVGTRTVTVINPLPLTGVYTGTAAALEFGGSAIPLEFALEISPSDALTLEDADERYLLLTTDPSYMLSLPTRTSTADWLRAPLTWDPSVDAWVATFSTPVRSEAFAGTNIYPSSIRTVRIELNEIDSEKRILQGAITDRWRGIHERRSVDAIPENGVAVVSSNFEVARDGVIRNVVVEDAPFENPGNIPSPTPNLNLCSTEIIAATVVAAPGENPDEVNRPCGNATTAAGLSALEPEQLAECGIALGQVALQGDTIGSQLRAYIDPSVDNPYEFPFKEFLEHCASTSSSICTPSPSVSCARNVTATAYREVSGAYARLGELAETYDSLTNELFLGQKLGAFQTDTSKRLEWLRSSEAPLFLASALRDYNESLLNSWQALVLQPHLDVVFNELDAAGLSFLTRSTNNPDAMAWRAARILQVSTNWQTAAESLSLYMKRRNVIDQNSVSRAAEGRQSQQVAFRLYLAGAILADVARDSAVSAYVSPLGPHLARIFIEARRLSLPFSKLIYARDAEVVTSQSLDPTSNSRTLLGELRQDALTAIRNANNSVQLVLTEADNAALNEEYIVTRYEDQLIRTRNELIQLCGLKTGCLASEVGSVEACNVETQVDACGFELQRGETVASDPSRFGVSEASQALVKIQAAMEAVNVAEERERAEMTQLNLIAENAKAFEEMIEAIHADRMTALAQVEKLFEELAAADNEFVNAAVENIRQRTANRTDLYTRQKNARDAWQAKRETAEEEDRRAVREIRTAQNQAAILGHSADMIRLAGEVAADTLNTTVSKIDLFVKLKAATLISAYAVQLPLSSSSVNQEVKANNLSAVLEEGFYAVDFAQDESFLAQLKIENDIAALEEAIELGQIQDAATIRNLEAAIEAAQALVDIELEYERNSEDAGDRWMALEIRAAGYERLTYETAQARLTLQQRILNFVEISQRAEVLGAQFSNMKQRFNDIESLLGSADAIFAFHNQMTLAESRLDYARQALENWLVALEYYAVRPFVDQRMAILLARNPQQLEAIANELVRLQNACGGAISNESVEVSLRDDLLLAGFAMMLPSEQIVSPGERFRGIMARAQTGASRTVRISTSETVGQRLVRGNVLSADFRLEIDAFANLAQTCNAKVSSLAVKLVGLKEESGLPVITIVYDGNSQLRSCQSNIRQLVSSLGPESTAFNTITTFRTGGRAISPIAGIGSYGNSTTWNATLEGTPLAAGYSVLIDLEHPSNRSIDWTKLEDIQLLVNYSYQDVFVAGQCE